MKRSVNIALAAMSWLARSSHAICLLGLVIMLGSVLPVMAAEVRVAVAANFTAPIQHMASEFERATGHKLVLSFGSTGKFYAQIRNGAPFDILLSADDSTPAKLEQEGIAVAGSRFTFAVGKLVLWSRDPAMVDGKGMVLVSGSFKHLALVNPKLAPYGAAGVETMEAIAKYEKLKERIVLGENLTQAYQFIASGNAELGFVALSQIYRNGSYASGSYWIVPENLYRPIRQDAVILLPGKGRPEVVAFLDFLRSERAKTVIRSFGYET